MTTCARGCTIARSHQPDCETPDDCKGCTPRPAEHGLLCRGCHVRLLDMLDRAHGQRLLLLALVNPGSGGPPLTAETTARIGDGWRLNSGQPMRGPYARPSMFSELGEPMRLAALDSAQRIDDVLSCWAEMVAQQHDLHGPVRTETAADREHGRPGWWRWSEYAGDVVWTEPPLRYATDSAARWLAAQVARLETCHGIADLWAELADVMSQAHSLAPWRQSAERTPAVPCPECHAVGSLVVYGGDDFHSCQRCRLTIDPKRWRAWVLALADREDRA